MTKTIKALTHWLSELVFAVIVMAAGFFLIAQFSGNQSEIKTAVFTTTIGGLISIVGATIVVIGALGLANSVRRGLFKRLNK